MALSSREWTEGPRGKTDDLSPPPTSHEKRVEEMYNNRINLFIHILKS